MHKLVQLSSEYIPLLTPLGGLFVAVFPIRLVYLEKGFEKFSKWASEQKKLVDKELQKEIKKAKPEKAKEK